jgi:hypothetical protein
MKSMVLIRAEILNVKKIPYSKSIEYGIFLYFMKEIYKHQCVLEFPA